MKSATVLSFDKTPLPLIDFSAEGLDDGQSFTPRLGTPLTAEEVISALEGMPHLSRQIIRLWRTRELNTLIHKLLLDSRDGSRQGFPHEVARELMFLAKLNVVIRAHEAAPLLGITVGEACQLIEKGDNAALGHIGDDWGHGDRTRSTRPLAGPHGHTHGQGQPHAPEHGHRHGHHPHHEAPLNLEPLSPLLKDAPPIPPSVCLDLTTARTLRHDQNGVHREEGDVMDQGFFRCIAKELGGLGVGQLVLSDLGTARRCSWLPAAVSFAKQRCHFPKVILHVDPLAAHEPQLLLAMASGLDHLVLNVNLASGKWRAQAEAVSQSTPDYFRQLVRRLVRSRDELAAKSGHHCAISVIQINHKSVYHLSQTFTQMAREPGLEPYRHIAESKRAENTGACHCWSPFIEAHVRTNGHLVACAQDHSGYSFTADLKVLNFTDAWHGQVFRNTRQRVLHGEKPGRMCEICPHLAARQAENEAQLAR